MSHQLRAIQQALTKNRAEELGLDVWTDFVVPLFFDQIDLQEATKPRIIVGGRGCGKTMLLRYLSHPTRFSRHRPSIPPPDLQHIGLYWRADTQFVTTMSGRAVDEEIWKAAFTHSLSLSIAREVIASIYSIKQSASRVSPAALTDLRFRSLKTFDQELGDSLDDFSESLQKLEWEFQVWLNNPRTTQQPRFLPVRHFLKAIIGIIHTQIPELAQSSYSVFIDEYENLLGYQQVVVNTMLKHSEPPLVFHIAMKRNGMRTRETLGEESITDIADYRTVDLDSHLQEHDFGTYAAEILLMRLSSVTSVGVQIEPATLNDPDGLSTRRSAQYKKSVASAVKTIFPTLTREELAEAVFADEALQKLLRKAIASALRFRASNLNPEQFIRQEFKQASLIIPALLYRSGISPELVLSELRLLQQGKANKFTGTTDWIHNNFEGCLLYLYAPYDRTCPFYAGYETYIQLAQSNLRHFLELCYRAMKRIPQKTDASTLVVPAREQAEAAKQASAAFVSEIKAFGRRGNGLYSFVLTLGSLFALSQRRPSQSEPEINHFSIVSGGASLSQEDEDFFREAVKWSVLIEQAETKLKDPLQPFGQEWVLNPIYSPFFHITYRKRRKLSLSVEDVIVLVRGSYDDRKQLIRKFSENWLVNTKDLQMSLFPGLTEAE